MGNESFAMGGEEVERIIKVFMWTVASAFVVLAIDWIGMIDMPAQYAFIVPMANLVLFSLKEWIADNRF